MPHCDIAKTIALTIRNRETPPNQDGKELVSKEEKYSEEEEKKEKRRKKK